MTDLPSEVKLLNERYIRTVSIDIQRRYLHTKHLLISSILALLLSLPYAFVSPYVTLLTTPWLFGLLLFLFSTPEKTKSHDLLLNLNKVKNLLPYFGLVSGLPIFFWIFSQIIQSYVLNTVLFILSLTMYFLLVQSVYSHAKQEMRAEMKLTVPYEEKPFPIIPIAYSAIIFLLVLISVLSVDPILSKYNIPTVAIAFILAFSASLSLSGLLSKSETYDPHLYYMKAIYELAEGMRMRLVVGEHSLMAFLGALREATHPFLVQLRRQLEPQLELNVPISSVKYELPQDFPDPLIKKLKLVLETANDPTSTAKKKLEGFIDSLRETIRLREIATAEMRRSVQQVGTIIKFLGPAILGLSVGILYVMQKSTVSLLPEDMSASELGSEFGIEGLGMSDLTLNIDPKLVSMMFIANFVILILFIVGAEFLSTYLVYKDKKLYLRNVLFSFLIGVVIMILSFIAIPQMMTSVMQG